VIFQENHVRSLQSGLEAKKEEIKLTRVQSDRLELELNGREERISKLRSALNMAKTNKEYSAILTELNTAKADNTKLEAEVLDLMKNIEADEGECLDIQVQIDEQKKKLEDVRNSANEQTAKLEADIAEIKVEWDVAAGSVSAEVLEVFRRTADTYDGEAIADVEMHDERTEVYSCGGCFMRIPAETVNQLMTRDEILRCTSCSRILVLRKDFGI
jgi:predicted  nucleic acid-binding Zn-ribbon protein